MATAGESSGGYDAADSDQAQYANEYWGLESEAYAICLELAPECGGDSVGLGDLEELCRRMGRPIQDERERMMLMNTLDPGNEMRVDRQAFTAWLFQEIYTQKQIATAQIQSVASSLIIQQTWEEVVDEQGQRYFYNTLTGETVWELSRFAMSLRGYLDQVDEIRSLKAPSLDAVLDVPNPDPTSSPDVLDDLNDTFIKFDDDGSGTLDSSEFRDLCVAMGFLLGSEPGVLEDTMLQVDPANSGTVTLEALRRYFINQTPFLRRVRLPAPLDQWEQVESLDSRRKPAKFRHCTTQSERWCHPHTEQRAVDAMLRLLPSARLEWHQRIATFIELQAGIKTSETPPSSAVYWNLSICRRVLAQVGHDCRRIEHLDATIAAIRSAFGSSSSVLGPGLDFDTIMKWLQHCVTRVEMEGWAELVDETTGQRYYYHEILGVTQWDPPHLEANMAKMLARFGGDGSNSSAEDKIYKIFHHYDEDESGSISFQEFKRMYVALIGRHEAVDADADDHQIQQLFSVLDTSGDDAVSLDEFLVWWKTKLKLADEETADQRALRLLVERERTAIEFLARHDALLLDPETGIRKFESNMLPRLVGILGKYPLRGLAFRDALNELVLGVEQHIDVAKFLDWYARFDRIQKEKEELELEKSRALARIQAEEAEAKEKARQLKMLRKGQLLTRAIAQDVSAPPEPAEIVWKRHVETLFRKFDSDGSGFLDANELQGLTQALGHEMTSTQVAQMLRVMDSSGDGCVSLDEFLTFWTAYQRRKRAKQVPGTGIQKAAATHQADSSASHRREAISMVPTSNSASLVVSLELAKDRALQLSMDDITSALGDLKYALVDRSKRKQEAKRRAEMERQQLEELRRSRVFVPTKTRRYAHLDVTWIEPEVVRCVVDMIHWISDQARPLPKPDAALQIQRIIRGCVTRMRVLAHILTRFVQHVDLDTGFYYYTDIESSGTVWLHRPVFRTITSSAFPWELTDCQNKIQRLEFHHRVQEMERKQQFYHKFIRSPDLQLWKAPETKRLYVPSSFVVYKVLESIRRRLLGSLWTALRVQAFVLAELMATRHPRQLRIHSDRDAARPLPLHYLVQHHRIVLFRLIQAAYAAYTDAVRMVDAYARTPLHLAFRERAPRSVVELLLSQRHRLYNAPTRQQPARRSVWIMQSFAGDTPLHVALRYGVELELLRWVLRHESVSSAGTGVWTTLNHRGHNVLLMVVAELFDGSPYWKSVVLVLLRLAPVHLLCGLVDGCGDLALHLALHRSSQVDERGRVEEWTWLIRTLVDAYPAALVTTRKHDALLAVHLAIRSVHLPEDLAIAIFQRTLQAVDKQAASVFLTLAATQSTLVHYALLHRPGNDLLLSTLLTDLPTSADVAMQPSGDLPLHVAVRTGVSLTIVQRLLELNGRGCLVRNSHQQLPIHAAATSRQCTEEVIRLLLHHCPFVWNDPIESRGLKALVMAANVATPSASVLRALLATTPAQPLTPHQPRHVTPLYAISLRRCDDEVQQSGVLTELDEKFDRIQDEDAYFLAMAKAKHRKRHHCPTAAWSFPQILELMARNPLDEAILQRSFLAINDKLAAMRQQQPENQDAEEELLESVALNAEWMLVRRVHEVMYETPQNARVQLLGQAILLKLLPTAFAKAAYKHRIDPYFDL